MVARVLIINEYQADLCKISSSLKKAYNFLSFSETVESTIRILSTQSTDIVLIMLPEEKSELFSNFFAVLRQLCGVIPIVGIFKEDPSITHQYIDKSFDDFIGVNISEGALNRKIRVLTKLKDMFDDTLFNCVYIKERRSRKIITIFHDNLDFLHESVLQNTEIVQLESWPVDDSIHDNTDLFIINASNIEAYKCCSSLRLKRVNKYKPIVLSYNSESKEKVKSALEIDIGCTDAINSSADSVITGCKLNSLMKYKKTYESFTNKLKKNIYLSAIDATTGVYNRSFFEDYIEHQEKSFFDSAVFVIDIDKFKVLNDKYGHSFADSMLKLIANSIKKHVRTADIIARYGGDEFIIFMDNVSKKTAEAIALRIQKTIEQSTFQNVSCTVSIGVCCIDARGKLKVHNAISIADKFMYIVKKNGGNAVQICA